MRACIALAFLGIMLIGCSDDRKPTAESGRASKKGMVDKADKEKEAREPAGEGQAKGDAPADPKPRARKVVYTGRIELLVEDFDEGQAKLAEVIESNKAYVARSETKGEPGTPRSGTWTIRVPVAGFDALMDAVAGLGEARKKSKDSDDVTDRYYDTEAEALNLEAREKTLRKLYEETKVAAKVSEIMEVDRELTRVRGDINVRRGQMKRWDNLADFSTLEVAMRDRKGYVPPESPEFTTQIGRTWNSSLEALVSTSKALVIFAVAVAPWLALPLVMTLVLWVMVRLLIRLTRKPAVVETVELVEAPESKKA